MFTIGSPRRAAPLHVAGRLDRQESWAQPMRRLSVRHAVVTAVSSLLAVGAAAAANAAGEDTAITIYSSAEPGAISPDLYRPVPGGGVPNASSVPGYAMVRQERDVKLASGRSTLKFADVAALIDPTTVTFTSLTEPRDRKSVV